MATITVSPETNTQLKQYASEKGCTTDEAAEKLIDTAIGRLSAIRKYAKRIAGEGAPKAKAKPAKAAKPAPAAKPPKAKKAKVAPAAEA